MKKPLGLVLALLLAPTLATAWGPEGHAIVAQIAEDNLTEAAASKSTPCSTATRWPPLPRGPMTSASVARKPPSGTSLTSPGGRQITTRAGTASPCRRATA